MATAPAAWTVMVYMAGDNNLSEAGETDLGEMRSVGSSDAVNLVVQFDDAGDSGTRRYKVAAGGTGELVEDIPETDSGSPEALAEFCAWTAERFPAERHALVLWSHGSGWEPSEMTSMAEQAGAAGASAQESSERSASPTAKVLFRTSLERMLSLPTAADRAICFDDGSGHYLDMIELSGVLATVVERLGHPLDLLGMDACLMSTLEVAYQVSPYARYMVGSEEIEPNNGWPWDKVLRRLVDAPRLTAEEFATGITADYLQSYADAGSTSVVTQSAFDLAKTAEVAAAVDALADALVAGMPASAADVWTAQRGSAHFCHDTLWDLAEFARCLAAASKDDAVCAACAGVDAVLAVGGGHFVMANTHQGDAVAGCGGVSLYLVPPLVDISRWYPDVELSKQHRWVEMLRRYHQA